VRLLVTRPEPDGERTAAKLRARGSEVLVAPMLHVEMLTDAVLGAGPWSALVMTSANAVHAVARHPRCAELMPLPVFAVGRRTAEAARAAGFGDVTSADGDVAALVRLVATRCPRDAAPLLYLAGEDRSGDLAGDLAVAGLRVAMVVVYRTAAAAGLPASVQAALGAGRIDGVLHFSRRSAEIYLNCAESAGVLDSALAPFHYCLSQQVAGPLAAAGAVKVKVAPRPEEAALIDLVLSS
jgi:uroporphyrinogen-III synthase